jgi:hypothetical protein
MIESKDITVITPCLYPSKTPLWMFLASCRRFGVVPSYYAEGETYSGWVDIMLTKLMEAARACPTSHMLYTDSRDAFFLAGMDEVVDKYNWMGCPTLMLSADSMGFPGYEQWYDKVPWDLTKAFPYFQVGGKIGEAKVIAEAIKWMFSRARHGDWGNMPGDNPPWWCNFMAERPGELVIDHNCEIFQCATNVMDHLLISKGRMLNSLTGSRPCILHFNGGYTDQFKGKWYAMEKTWRQLGYTENPPWEGE